MNDRGFSLPLQTLIVLIGALLSFFCNECLSVGDSVLTSTPSSNSPLNLTDCSLKDLNPGEQCCTEKQPACSTGGPPKVIQENCSTGIKDESENKKLYRCELSPPGPPPVPPPFSSTSKLPNSPITGNNGDAFFPPTLPPNPQDASHSSSKIAIPPSLPPSAQNYTGNNQGSKYSGKNVGTNTVNGGLNPLGMMGMMSGNPMMGMMGMSQGGNCDVSKQIEGKYDCSETQQITQGAMISNALLSSAASSVVQAQGQMAQSQAVMKNSQKEILETTAANNQNAGESQMTLGAMNAALGALQISRYQKHTDHSKEIDNASQGNQLLKTELRGEGENAQRSTAKEGEAGYISSRNQVTKKILDHFDLNTGQFTEVNSSDPETRKMQMEKRKVDMENQYSSVKSDVGQIGRDATSEQKSTAAMAMMGGMTSMMTGAQQALNGKMNYEAGKKLKAAAEKMNVNSNVNHFVSPPGLDSNWNSNISAPSSPGVITGDGTITSEASDSSNVDTNMPLPPSMGNGFDPNPIGTNGPVGPSAGTFNRGGDPGGGGGGGGGVGDGASTAPANSGDFGGSTQQAQMAGTSSGPSYDGGGGTFGAGGGGPGKGAEGGPDLSALMEKFLPKKDDPARSPNGILDFGGPMGANGSSPSAMSVLDRSANIFQRIHETYQEKSLSGALLR